MSTTTQERPTTAVSTINVEEISTTMENAGLILVANETLADKAVKGAQQLLDTIEAEGMSDDLDKAANDWQVKSKSAVKILNDRRAPITQMMTRLAGLFTSQEGKLDPKKPESAYARIQKVRNQWATHKANEAKKKEQAILKAQNEAKERISLKAEIQMHIRSIFNGKLGDFKKAIQNKYNALTLENKEEIESYIKNRPVVYPVDAFRKLEPSLFPAYLGAEEVAQMIVKEREELYDELAATFRENMEVEISNTLELLPSRIKELQEIAKADDAEKKRLEGQASERKRLEDERLSREQSELAEKDKLNVQATVQMETAGALFDSTTQLAEVSAESTGKTKTGYKIDILNTTGVIELYNFYFQKEGKGLSVDDLLKKTGNQMKAFAEKHALKTDEMIESKSLIYNEDVKAIASAK